MRLAIVVLAVALAGCTEGKAERDVRSTLKDPDSAKFSDVWTKGNITCGTVNAKNAMGGYVGDTPFLLNYGLAVYSGDGAFACCQKLKEGAPETEVTQCVDALPDPAIVTR